MGKCGEGEYRHGGRAPAVPSDGAGPSSSTASVPLMLPGAAQAGVSQVITQPACSTTAADWLSHKPGAATDVILSCCQGKESCKS